MFVHYRFEGQGWQRYWCVDLATAQHFVGMANRAGALSTCIVPE